METIFDWISLILFIGLAILYLQRSVEAEARDRIVDYIPPAIACAVANYFGNNGHPVAGVVMLLVATANILIVLKPFTRAAPEK